MAKNTNSGEVDWNEAGSAGKTEYMRLQQNDNIVRVMDKPIMVYVHWIDTAGGKKAKIVSPTQNPALVDRIVNAGFPQKQSYYLRVLDRENSEKEPSFKILEVGPQIINQLKDLIKNKRYGTLEKYDVNIKKGAKGSNPLYTVIPEGKVPNTPEELKAYKEWNSNIDIERFSRPAPDEKILEMLGLKEEEEDSGSGTDDFDFES